MRICIALPHVFNGGSTHIANARALRILLDCLISLNEAFLRDHTVKPLYQAGVVYDRTEIWDTIPALYQRGYGDCKSLSAALVAEYRKAGKASQAVFRWIKRPDGSNIVDYHILVQTPNGFEDPSKVLGMGTNENRPMTGTRRY